jgi:hypothetical protein
MRAKSADIGAAEKPGAQTQSEQTKKPISGSSPPGTAVGQTDEERLAHLERKLNMLLSDFDGTLLRATQRLSEAADESHAGGSSPSGAASAGGYKASGSASGADASGGGTTPEESVATARGGTGGFTSGAKPTDIPEGDDDDIVARQLREAAENETDPVLRKKLWREYRDYKAAAGVSP